MYKQPWANLKEYQGRVLARNGPLIGKAAQITYNVLGFCHEDRTTIHLESVFPFRRPVMQPDADIIAGLAVDLYAAEVGDPCRITVIDGEVRLELLEALYVSQCGFGGAG
jgi:hypothetical protein